MSTNRLSVFKGIAVLLLLVLISACSYKNKNTLFKETQKVNTGGQPVFVQNASNDSAVYRHRIKADDRIVINILNNYDLTRQNVMTNTGEKTEEKSFLIGSDGIATIPILGRVQLSGLTRQEASRKLEQLYTKFIVNPIIDVSIVNLSVSVLGEVRTPGTYPLDKEYTTLVEVLAMAGGITDNGKLKNIKIIRGDLQNPEVIFVDLRQLNSLHSVKLAIHDRDIVYVEPTGAKLVGTPVASLSPYFIILTSFASLLVAIRLLRQ